MKHIAILSLLLTCAACGKQGPLTPRAGQGTPPLPLGATAAPTPEQQLARRTQAAPRRVDDPLTRSSERPDDPFDLPPKR